MDDTESEPQDLLLSEVHGSPQPSASDMDEADRAPHSQTGLHRTKFDFSLPAVSRETKQWLDRLAQRILGSAEPISDQHEELLTDSSESWQAIDSDGDLDPPRKISATGTANLGTEDVATAAGKREESSGTSGCITIDHSLATDLPAVGLQVWKGALLLGDLLLALGDRLHGITAVELGAGTGLPGMLLSRVADHVFLTDSHAAAALNCASNVEANSHAPGIRKNGLDVRMLDWSGPFPWQVGSNNFIVGGQPLDSTDADRFQWTAADIRRLQNVDLIIAADVVYDDTATEAFLSCVASIMQYRRAQSDLQSSGPAALAAVEKRFNFGLRDLKARAHAFEHFCSLLDAEYGGTKLVGYPVDVSRVPQSFEYTRGSDLELWLFRPVSELRALH